MTSQQREKAITAVCFAVAAAIIGAWVWFANTRGLDVARSYGIDVDDLMNCGTHIKAEDWMIQATICPVVYVLVSGIFMVFDLYLAPNYEGWKIAYPKWKAKLNHGLYRKATATVLFNNSMAFFIHLFVLHPAVKAFRSDAMCGEQMPSSAAQWLMIPVRLVAVYVLTDVVFYFTHRLCHEVPFLYQYIHKYHHQWVDTYAVAAVAAHPLEHWFVNLHTVSLPCMIAGVPFHWYTVWLGIAVLNTCVTHSGYQFPGSGAPVTHDYHHHLVNCEYGTNVFCDRWLKTSVKDFEAKRAAAGLNAATRISTNVVGVKKRSVTPNRRG